MKIGLASDSFGNVEALGRAFDTLMKAGADRIFFLGGRFGDVDTVLERKRAGAMSPAPPPPGDLGFLHAVEAALAGQVTGSGRREDAERLEGRIVRVVSRACPEYQRAEAPKKVFELVDGNICCLVHDKSELSRDDIANATVLFHGNSGHPAIVQIGPRYFVTPGHLRSPEPAGKPASFALLDLGATKLELVVYSVGGEVVRRERAVVGARSKISVK